MKDYFERKISLNQCMFPSEMAETMIELKLNEWKLDDVKEYIKELMSEAKEIRDTVLSNIDESKIDYSIKSDFLKLSQDIIKNKIIEEVRKGVS